MLYKNIQDFNDGIRLKGQTPLDDRLVANDISDLYLAVATASTHDLYNRAYRGLTVTVVSTNDIYICTDATPYTPATVSVVKASNFGQYWKRVSMLADDEGTMPTIKIINDKITGGKYKIIKLSTPASGMFASYKLQYAKPGETTYADISGSIQMDIPELEVVDEVHVCKAYHDASGWHETSRQGDSGWDSDTNEVYLHILWDVKDPSGTAGDGRETYINVSDMIKVDIDDVSSRLKSLSDTTEDLSTYVRTTVNSSISDVSSRLQSLSNTTSDLSTYVRTTVNSSISDVSSRLKSLSDTVGGGGGDSLTDKINQVSTYVHVDLKNYVDDVSSYAHVDLKDYIDEQYTSLNNIIINEVSTAIARVELEIMDVSGNVAANKAIMDSSFRALDASWIELYNHSIEITEVWAAAWNALFAANPNLHKPGEEPVGGQGIYYDTIDNSISLNESDIKTLQYYDNATNVYTGIMTNKRYCYLAIPEGKTFTMVTSNTEPIQDDFQLIGTTNVDGAAFTLYCLDQDDLPMDDVTSTITVI